VRFPFPILYHVTSGYGVYMLSSPSIGFNVSGLSAQNTITESTEYNLNLPIEFYAQTASIEQTNGVANALLHVDVKPAMELVSPAFATAIGLKSNRYFFLGQAAAGLELYNSVRVGFQYFFGPQSGVSSADNNWYHDENKQAQRHSPGDLILSEQGQVTTDRVSFPYADSVRRQRGNLDQLDNRWVAHSRRLSP
jgi:hypothetical protein